MYRWSSGALADVAGTAAPPALGALRRSSDQTPDTSCSGPSPHRPPEELRQHPGLRVHARLRSSHPPADGIILPAGSAVGRSNLCSPQKFQRACFVLLGFEPGRLLGGDDTRAGTCTVERHDRRGLIASGRHELE